MTFFIENHSREKIVKCFRKICNTKTLKRRLPIVEWLPKYTTGILVQDVIAGLTVGLTAIAQGLAYATVAGLPPEYGLYSSLTAGLIYLIFGTNPAASVGPTAILSTLTAKYVSSYTPDFAVLLAFLSGVFMVIISILRLGFIVEFMSVPVISGFTSAAALQVSSSQLKSLFGLSGSSGNNFGDSVWNFIINIKTIQLWDSLLGLGTIVLLYLLKILGEGCSRKGTLSVQIKWFLSLSRNIMVVIIGAVITYTASFMFESQPLTLIGEIKGGLPSFGLPPFGTTSGNETYTFKEMVDILGAKSIVIPFVSILEIIVMGKAFSEDGRVDAGQEMFALGLCNVIGSFTKSMPITGSFSRTALNHSSGVQTQAGNILTFLLIVLSLTFLTSVFYFIPKPTLAGLIIAAVLPMINSEILKKLWRNSKRELIILLTTVVICLFYGLEYGIIVGMLMEACTLIYKTARPNLEAKVVTFKQRDMFVILLPSNMLYCSADSLRQKALDILSTSGYNSVTIIDGSNLQYLDFTVASNLMSVVKDFEKSKTTIYLLNFKNNIKKVCLELYSESNHFFVDNKTHLEVMEKSDIKL